MKRKGDVEMSIINLSELSYDDSWKAGTYYFLATKTRTEDDKGLDNYEVMRKQMMKKGICESDIELAIATVKKMRNEE